MKFVLIPDSFKGTMSSIDICNILSEEIGKIFPAARVLSIPVADGGEGTVDAFLRATGGIKACAKVRGPYFENVWAHYALLSDGTTAVVEMAACAGLPMVGDNKNPEKTTTFGVGQLILEAAKKGSKKIVVGLGGSATNDAGCGMAAALGIEFYNRDGEKFVPTGGTLIDISRIDYSKRSPLLEDIEIVTMCDIRNPMYGSQGAAYIFGPQKGADAEMVKRLDAGLQHLGNLLDKDTGLDVSNTPGAGSAGAMGAGMMAFLGSRLQLGIQTVLDVTNFDSAIKDADFIITGEGRMDGQSLGGKVVIGVAERAKKYAKPVIAIVGGVLDDEIQKAYSMGINAVFSINRLPEDFSISQFKTKENIRNTFANILRLISLNQASLV